MAGPFVLGLGGTVDYEIRWSDDTITERARHHGIQRSELTTDLPITDERSLLVAVLGFVATGGGGERFLENSAILSPFADQFDTAVTLGGTGVRAGLAMAAVGVGSVQHLVSIDDTVRRLLPPAMTYLCSATDDTLDPHLIVQYPQGARVSLADGVIEAPNANRVIVANDPPNRSMALSPELPQTLSTATGFLVSGFNTMVDESLLVRRLDDLRAAMDALPPGALVFYEDAGFYRAEFSTLVRERLLDRITVYSMNEDELQERLGRRVDLLSAPDVAQAMNDAHERIPVPALVVHSHAWAIARGPLAPALVPELTSAVQMAATRYRVGDALTARDFDATSALALHPRGVELVTQVVASDPSSHAGVAGFVLDVPTPTTIGLGDTFVGGFLAAAARRDPTPW
jgi:ADP-dependent phosphofructokinase/glucokinase